MARPGSGTETAAMHGADEQLIRELANDVRATRDLMIRDKESTMRLLYIVSAAIFGGETARKIFHMESIIQDPNVQGLIREWKDEGRAEGRDEGRAEGRITGRAEGRAEGRITGRAEGHAAGHAAGRTEEARLLLFKVLAKRSVSVTPAVWARIEGETDLARLEQWIDTALSATSIDDVLRDG